MIRMFLALSVAALPMMACTADPSDGTLGPDASTGPSEETIESVELFVEPPPPVWEYPSISINGRGPSGGTLRYMSTSGGQEQRTLGADGSFCIDIPLTQDSVTTATFEAISTDGMWSDPVTVEIRQSGEPPIINENPITGGEHDNVAENSNGFDLEGSVEEGALEALVDGDTSAYVSLRNAGDLILDRDFLTFSLAERGKIKQFAIHSDSSCVLEKYDVFLSDVPDPGRLFVHDWWSGTSLHTDWTKVASIDGGSAEEVFEPNIGSPYARHFGIQFRSRDCGPKIGTGRHKISEIQVYAEVDGDGDDDESIGDGYPSCLTGGL